MGTALPTEQQVTQTIEELDAALQTLQAQVLELTYVGNRKDVDPAALAAVLASLKGFKSTMKLMEDETSKALSTVTSDGATVEAGPVYLERRDSKPKKTWKHDQLKSIVIEKVIARHTDEESGTVDTPTSVLIQEAFQYAGISYWKVGALKEIGINANDYCQHGEAKASFSVVDSAPQATKDEDDDFLD